jgi:ABC-type cobalt transport system substrate-binding protein
MTAIVLFSAAASVGCIVLAYFLGIEKGKEL